MNDVVSREDVLNIIRNTLTASALANPTRYKRILIERIKELPTAQTSINDAEVTEE